MQKHSTEKILIYFRRRTLQRQGELMALLNWHPNYMEAHILGMILTGRDLEYRILELIQARWGILVIMRQTVAR